jgi:hypothetical protein
MKISQLLRVSLLVLVIPVLSGCWLLAAGGAGAYGGYKAKEEGYTLQNPIKKEEQDTKEKNKPTSENQQK